ncbi:uncharacterized protein yc1106_00149 [Curvularia clavata]|uniref:ceramidase n=1 Tax=Curvularia clavata TaxID=95742 RepID=A0A9Q8Z0P0_CURCL|nr:uncharacterized protein yc1106_00149 [Curvularia clavata]
MTPNLPPPTATSMPPTYTINLSSAPLVRYKLVAKSYSSVLRQIANLYTEAISNLGLPVSLFHFLGRLLLYRLYSQEQTEELRGISQASRVPMYLLVGYNVFLDLLLGCTSGGMLVRDSWAGIGEGIEETTMMHFRTLDWPMPVLRDAIVQFEYIETTGGDVIARTLGYVGFVGVLTGVRKGLSVSLNFRPYHNASGVSIANFSYYWNTLMVLLGRRPSISTILRDFLLPSTTVPRRGLTRRGLTAQEVEEAEKELMSHNTPPHTPQAISSLLPTLRTPAAYLIFCTPTETIILEKDLQTTKALRSSSFLSATNHDLALETDPLDPSSHTQAQKTRTHAFLQASMHDILAESIERKHCLTAKWAAWSQRQARQAKRGQPAATGVTLVTLRRWVETYPVCNEVTHFACIMDPSQGVFRWVRKFEVGEIGEG